MSTKQKSTSSTNMTQETQGNKQIPDWASNAVHATVNQLGNLVNTPYQPYTGELVAPLQPYQTQALGQIQNIFNQGQPVQTSANQSLQDTLNGQYLDQNNPALQGLYKTGADALTRSFNQATLPMLSSAANRAGAFGGSADQLVKGSAAQDLSNSLGNLANNIFGQNYQNERGRMIQAAGLSPAATQADYTGAQQLLNAGNVMQGQQQNVDTANYGQFQNQQNWPVQMAQLAASALPGLYQGYGTTYGKTNTAGETTNTQSGGNSLAGNIFGGVAGALMLPSMVGNALNGVKNIFGGATSSGYSVPYAYSNMQNTMMAPYQNALYNNIFGGGYA
jgi:hypothetical protein